MPFFLPPALLALCLTLCWCENLRAETIRDQEIAECRSDEIATWRDGIDRPTTHATLRIIYRHTGAPAWFDNAQVARLIDNAAKAWSQCGISLTLADAEKAPRAGEDTVLVQWSDAGSMGNFGLANLTRQTLSLGPAAFAMLRSRNPAHDASETLQMVISHEMGHFLGLMAHSRRCVDVLSYYHDGKGGQCQTRNPAGRKSVAEYRHVLPTACDIERCRRLNGL